MRLKIIGVGGHSHLVKVVNADTGELLSGVTHLTYEAGIGTGIRATITLCDIEIELTNLEIPEGTRTEQVKTPISIMTPFISKTDLPKCESHTIDMTALEKYATTLNPPLKFDGDPIPLPLTPKQVKELAKPIDWNQS